MQITPERSPTAPQAIRAHRMQSQQDAARLQAAGGRQEFAATLQNMQHRPANMAGPGTPTGNTLAALLQRLDRIGAALACLDRFLELVPSGPVAERIRALTVELRQRLN